MRDIVISLLLFITLSSSTALADIQQPAADPNQGGKPAQEDFRDKQKQVRQLAEQVLNGREVVIRLYDDWQMNPRAFEWANVSLDGLWVRFDAIESAFGDRAKSAVVVVLGEDQKDEVVAVVVADSVHVAEPYKRTKGFSIWPNFTDIGHKYWIFNDALGNPIPRATVETLIINVKEFYSRVSIAKAALDERSRLKRLERGSSLSEFAFIVSHPDYGSAMTEYHYSSSQEESAITYVAPLVRTGTEAGSRAVWGFVTDTQGKPVAGALITCGGVIMPGGGRLPRYRGGTVRSVTDHSGWFTMYMPVEKDGQIQSSLIPPGVKYQLTVTPPKALGLRQHSARLTAGQENVITLAALEAGQYFHTFAFEDADGPITDPNELEKITLTLNRDMNWRLSLEYADWKNGGWFPPGAFSAKTVRNGYPQTFEPVKMTPDSPELLVFKTDQEVRYQGQVVDGITGEPMQGVFVLVGHAVFGNRDASSITTEQWDALHACPDANHARALDIMIHFQNITQTDEQGWYHIKGATGSYTPVTHCAAFEKDYLSAWFDTMYLKPKKDGPFQIPTMRLFPAATVIVEPNLPSKSGLEHIRLRCYMDPKSNPPWVSSFSRSNDRAWFIYDKRLRPNKLRTVNVPAGLDMRIELCNLSKSKWSPITIDGVKLQQGEVLDLGRMDFQLALRVSVTVVDSAGNPVEGAAVQVLTNGRFWGQAVITNKNGTAFPDVPLHSTGQFVVRYLDTATKTPLQEGTPYEVAGEEDTGREFTLHLSDEILYHLFK